MFNPPSAPWWGGWWERLVQMTKAILRKILGRAALDYGELITKMRQRRSKFRIEYLGQLRQQSIKNYKDKPLSVGEFVLLQDNSKKRAYWSLARVLKLIPGCDGLMRLARIKTEHSEFLRPGQRLFRLELDNPVGKVNDDVIRVCSTSSGRVVKTAKRL
ncbi:integrase catalytic domain-containing protein [Trichonephila clavipes]|nr:integrase catalytic domain-containing protein [Trichonephila clavipes]